MLTDKKVKKAFEKAVKLRPHTLVAEGLEYTQANEFPTNPHSFLEYSSSLRPHTIVAEDLEYTQANEFPTNPHSSSLKRLQEKAKEAKKRFEEAEQRLAAEQQVLY